MKKSLLFQSLYSFRLFALFLLFLSFGSCKKEEQKDLKKLDFSDLVLIVQDFLSKQKENKTGGEVLRIEAFVENLDFAKTALLKKDDIENLVFIPYKSTSTLKHSLVIFTNTDGTFRKATRLRFQDLTGSLSNDFNKDEFYGLFTRKNEIAISGNYKFSSIEDYFLFKIEVTKNKDFKYGNLSAKNGLPQAHASGNYTLESCIDWYLVTTITSSNGTVTVIEEYLLTTCNGCPINGDLQSICEGDGGGSVGEPRQNAVRVENLSIQENEEDNSAGTDNSGAGIAPPIKYEYNATILREESSNTIISVSIYPIRADPLVSTYLDSYNRNVTRSLTLFNHVNNYSYLTPSSVMLNWSCAVHAKYSYTNGTPSWTRQWSKSRTSVR